MAPFANYLDAARNARPRQLAYRPRRGLPATLLAAGKPSAGWRPLAQGLGVDPAPQSGRLPDPAESDVLQAVGAARSVAHPELWTSRDDGLLFLFHLHGFAELAAYAAGSRSPAADRFWQELVRSWLRACGRPGGDGWHPFPTSGRVIAWCAALSTGDWPAALTSEMRASLGRQLLLLRRSVEHDVGGNHVLRNATALVVGGACLEDHRALHRGIFELERELPRQILADGGHEERAPSYHRAVLGDLHDVVKLLERVGHAKPCLGEVVEQMQAWLSALAGPDGRLPLLNDGWEGPPVTASGRPVDDLAPTGYVVLRHGADQAVLDLAPVSPPHLPPHAHADVGSFVLWIDGRLVVVDPGTCSYDEPERSRFRSTAAHSTLEVDGRDQFEPWGPFRAVSMPKVTRIGELSVEHDGYRRLPDPVTHRRTFGWVPGGGIVLLDRLLSGGSHQTVSRLPLAPGIRAGEAPLEFTPLGSGADPTVDTGRYAPVFGHTDSIEVVVRRAELAPGAVTGWALLRPGFEARIEGDFVSVVRDGSQVLEVRAA